MSLRVAELETLFTAKIDDIAKAEKEVQAVGRRIESKPIQAKVGADTANAMAGMNRVEQAAKTLVSGDTVIKLDADIARAETNVDRAKAKIEELKVRSLAGLDVKLDLSKAEANLQKLERGLQGLKDARSSVDVDANTTKALAALKEVQGQTQRLVSAEVVARVDADITRASNNLVRVQSELEVLRSQEPTVRVLADIDRAEARLRTAEGRLNDLEGARATMTVDADTTGAESALDGVSEVAGESGDEAGENFGDSIIAALATIPIAGAVIGIGKASADALIGAFNDGMQIEASYDRLEALTGLSEADAARIGRSAGEAYANVFGESVEANMDTARLALQFDILDENASTTASQHVIQNLAGIADVLGEDVRPVAAAVSTLLSSGVVQSADEAFDLIATGAREGVNRNEDLLDTLTEYPALFSRLGLNGEQALGLINQGLEAGARNSDLVADALKEFQIRATDGSAASAEGFRILGLNAAEMTAQIAQGGDAARDGLEEVLTLLGDMEDPVQRNAAAVALFGTQAEDLGEALFNLDLTTAVDGLNGVTGAAQRMFDTLADNDATAIEQAGRNIEVAADGIKGALAAAFGEPIEEFADWVSQNRGPLMEFLLGLANGAIEFGISMVESTATSTESLGEFVSGPLREAVIGIRDFIEWLPGEADLSGLDGLIDDMGEFDETTAAAADSIRDLVPGLEEAQQNMNNWAEPVVALGYLNDASIRLAESISLVGVNADGTATSLEGIDTANLSASISGSQLQAQIQGAIAAMAEEAQAAEAAGESQTELTDRWNAGREALAAQLVQMGYTQEQAQALIDTVMQTPTSATTTFSSNAAAVEAGVDELSNTIVHLPDGSVVVVADTSPATQAMNGWITQNDGRRIRVRIDATGGATYTIPGTNVSFNAQGNLLEFMAAGGVRGLSPMQPIAQVVPANTWRVVGDRPDVAEAYIPLDGSPRSMAILAEAIRRMGAIGMADGGILHTQPTASQAPLIGTLALGSTGNIRNDLDEVMFQLRRIRRGGRNG